MDPYRDTKPLERDFHRPQCLPTVHAAINPMAGPMPISQHTVICTQPAVVTVADTGTKPYTVGTLVCSCIVFWCCCWPLGLVAFIFAILASTSNDHGSARCYFHAANIMSGVGVVCGIIIWIILIILYARTAAM